MDIRVDLRKIAVWLKTRKVVVLINLGWIGTITSIIIVSYALLYIEHPEMTQRTITIYSHVPGWFPRILPLGYVIIVGTSLMAGALLADLGRVFWSCIISFSLSFLLSFLGAFTFVWFALGVGQNPIVLDIGFPAFALVLEYVFLNVVRMVFPIVPIACLMTSFGGAIIRSIIQPSAEA